MQATCAAANDNDADKKAVDEKEDAMKLSSRLSKKTVVTTKMVQRWSTTLSVSLLTLSVLIVYYVHSGRHHILCSLYSRCHDVTSVLLAKVHLVTNMYARGSLKRSMK